MQNTPVALFLFRNRTTWDCYIASVLLQKSFKIKIIDVRLGGKKVLEEIGDWIPGGGFSLNFNTTLRFCRADKLLRLTGRRHFCIGDITRVFAMTRS